MNTHDAALLADDIEAAAFADLYAAAPPALSQRLGLRVETVADATALLAPGLPVTMFNRVIGLGNRRPADDAALAELQRLYRGTGVRGWWLHANPVAQPADLARRAVDAGLVGAERRSWVKMIRTTASPPPIVTELEIRAASAAQAAATGVSIATAFSMPPFMADWLAALHGRPGWRLYTIADRESPVGGACLFLQGDAAWLGMGAVLPSHRGRGGQLGSMAVRIADAARAGCGHVITETGEPKADEPNPSLANMRSAGFSAVASRLNLEWRDDR